MSHAETPAENSTDASRKPACTLCTQRKVKCDRSSPCANCIKAGTVCVPRTNSTTRKRRRRPNTELQSRLARCEELLQRITDGPSNEPELASSNDDYKSMTPADLSYSKGSKSQGRLVPEAGSVRFTDSVLWGTMFEEVRAMKDLLENDTGVDANQQRPETPPSSADGDDLLLGNENANANANLQSRHPSPSHVLLLWQLFSDRVNPVTKVVHLPSVQPYLAQATAVPPFLPTNIEALLFAIYGVAVTSLGNNECISMFGSPKRALLNSYTSALRIALLRAKFLQTTDFVILQALTLHLLAIQGKQNGHATWILTGAGVRIAQKMGLHRDGQALGLSPFDTEMRRRVWWQIVLLDFRSGMSSGVSPQALPRSCDSKIPTNMNDSDLHPTATKHFEDREGPTDMIVFLVFCTILQGFLRQSNIEEIMFLMEQKLLYNKSEQIAGVELESLLKGVQERLEALMQRFADPTGGPLHDMAFQLKESMITNLRKMGQSPTERLGDGNELRSKKDNIFLLCIDGLEHTVQMYQSIADKNFLWFISTYFEHELFIFMAGELCHRLSGPLVERAWSIIPTVYQYYEELYDFSEESHVVLATFMLKAWVKRKAVLRDSLGTPPETPEYIRRLEQNMPVDALSAAMLSGMSVSPAPLAPEYTALGDTPWDSMFAGTGDAGNYYDQLWFGQGEDIIQPYPFGTEGETENPPSSTFPPNSQGPW